MKIEPTIQSPSFQYNSPLKTLWRKGKFPTVKYGFYGDKLTQQNISLEHLRPHSKGGNTNLDNLVLASKRNNQARGNEDIRHFLNPVNVIRYLAQFKGVKQDGFNGDNYIANIIKTLGGLVNV